MNAPVAVNTRVRTRNGNGSASLELPFEKPVVVPTAHEQDPTVHAWADARFWADIMSEHAFFFALLMPEELAGRERADALAFSKKFAALHQQIDQAGAPRRTDLRSFTQGVIEEVKPFIDFKARLGEAQASGKLRSLVWPLFFDHTREEAERFARRLDTLGRGDSEFERGEVVAFWADIMEQHSRFIAHLLDPDEFDLIDTATQTSVHFQAIAEGIAGRPSPAAGRIERGPDLRETDGVMAAAASILDFKTEAARGIEAARIKSIIDPRLADHVRREAMKFLDELERAR